MNTFRAEAVPRWQQRKCNKIHKINKINGMNTINIVNIKQSFKGAIYQYYVYTFKKNSIYKSINFSNNKIKYKSCQQLIVQNVKKN